MTPPNIKAGIIKYYFNIFIIMAEETTPKDITPMKRKGIDMTVKALKKPFPFIIGYKDDTTTQYESAHYIDLIIDLTKLSKYMGKPINPYWEKELRNDPIYDKTYALWSYLMFDEEDSKYSDDISKHPGYLLGKEIQEQIESIYEYLPDEYKLFYTYKSEWSTYPINYPVRLKVNAYYHKLLTTDTVSG